MRHSLARDYARIVALLADDAVLTADGGGMAKSAINPIYGPDRIANLYWVVDPQKLGHVAA